MIEALKLIHQKLDRLALQLNAIEDRLNQSDNRSPPLSLKQAAAYLHLSRSRVYDLVYAGELKPLQHRKHSRLLFSKNDLNQYVYQKDKSIPQETLPEKTSKKQ